MYKQSEKEVNTKPCGQQLKKIMNLTFDKANINNCISKGIFSMCKIREKLEEEIKREIVRGDSHINTAIGNVFSRVPVNCELLKLQVAGCESQRTATNQW